MYVLTESSVTIDHLVEIILHILEDESSVAVRLALLGVRKCLSPLLMGTHSPVGLEAVIKLLSIQNNPYWLVKVKYQYCQSVQVDIEVMDAFEGSAMMLHCVLLSFEFVDCYCRWNFWRYSVL